MEIEFILKGIAGFVFLLFIIVFILIATSFFLYKFIKRDRVRVFYIIRLDKNVYTVKEEKTFMGNKYLSSNLIFNNKKHTIINKGYRHTAYVELSKLLTENKVDNYDVKDTYVDS